VLVALDNFSAAYLRGHGESKTRANFRAAGVDGRATVQTADMRQLPFPAASFDAVLSAYAMDHLDPQGTQQTLREAARVLKPNGQFLLEVMCPDAWTRMAWGPLLFHGADAGRLKARWRSWLAEAGFDIQEEGSQPMTFFVLARRR
jgi:ubiquinone/menaquinone biosynthesis C-methylase UbiE